MLLCVCVLLAAVVVSCASQTPDVPFCNETIKTRFKTKCRTCPWNEKVSCPGDSTKLTTGEGKKNCKIVVRLSAKLVFHMQGCQHTCERTVVVASCCEGYWGPDCRSCPGGADNICSRHGNCSDGVYGNGTCYSCDDDFDGVACELCADSSHYGPDCAGVCKCIHGSCHHGIRGDGYCECETGYKGEYCDEVIASCETMKCHENARCSNRIEGIVCVCKYGYKGNGKDCQPVDRCIEMPPICHDQATCTATGPALFRCRCIDGYHGDGFMCIATDPCQLATFGDCPLDTTECVYEGPGKRSCRCLEGYESYIEGVGCTLIDVCLTNAPYCHAHANCSTVAPGQIDCLCEEGYIGDGRTCYGNIIQRMEELHANDPKLAGQLGKMLQIMKLGYHDALSSHGPFTVFAATDSGFGRDERSLSEMEYARLLLRQNLIAAQLTLDDLDNATMVYTLEGNTDEFTRINKLHGIWRQRRGGKQFVMTGDKFAANGIIHITDQLLHVDVGRPHKDSLANMLRNGGECDIFQGLLQTAGLVSLLDRRTPMVVFAPRDRAWDSLPPGTIDYLKSEEGKGKLEILLKSHIVSGSNVLSTDLVNMYRFVSIGNTAVSVTITPLGQIRLNGDVNITQTDIPATNGYIHHIDGVLIPSAIQPILPHRCDVYTYRGVLGTCGPCHGKLHCPLSNDVPMNETVAGCRYWVNMADWTGKNSYISFTGCAQMCNRTTTTRGCCAGFHGHDCSQCPGGFRNVCFGRGQCNDGYHGNGTCECNSTYYGTACEMCQDKNKFGPECDKDCDCLHGECDNGVASQGKCKRGTCEKGLAGSRCDKQRTKCGQSLRCHVHAECILKKVQYPWRLPRRRFAFAFVPSSKFFTTRVCSCKRGYEGSGSKKCTEIDPCQSPTRGGCHRQAKCLKTGPGKHNCTCDVGWRGDGKFCSPRNPCDIHGDCHADAKCVDIAVGQSDCECRSGYHGNGSYCVLIDMCGENHGGCHQNASCEATAPGEVNCTCGMGFGGDGISCYGSVAYEVSNQPSLSYLQNLIKRVPKADDYLADLSSKYTLLAPSNAAVSAFMEGTNSKFWQQEDNLLLMIGFHTVEGAVTVEDMRTKFLGDKLMLLADDGAVTSVNVTLKKGVICLNDAKILRADLPAANGYIHIIDKVLEPFPVPVERPTLEVLLSQHPEFSIFAKYLKDNGMIAKIEALNSSYTLFVPINDAVDSGDKTTMSHILSYYVMCSELTVDELQREVLLPTLLGTNQFLYFSTDTTHRPLVDGVRIVSQDLKTQGGLVHGIGGLLALRQHRCDQISRINHWSDCVPCSEVPPCPPGFTPSVPRVIDDSCRLNSEGMFAGGLTGCQTGCRKTILKFQCCEGYIGPDCKDPCEINNGGCQTNARCRVEGSQVTCRCMLGYIGDGYDCRSTCDLYNGGCHVLANCSIDAKDGSVKCVCPEGYRGNGEECSPDHNPCEMDNGGCSSKATCDYLEPAVVCTCNAPLVGNGTLCNSDIIHTLSMLPQTRVFYEMLKASDAMVAPRAARFLERLLDRSENLTVFVPVNTALMASRLDIVSLEDHVVEGRVYLFPSEIQNGTQLVTLINRRLTLLWRSGTGVEGVFQIEGIEVVERNIPVTNGVLHIIASPILDENSLQVSQVSVKWMRHAGVITGGIVPSLLIVIAVGVMAYRQRRRIGELYSRVKSRNAFSFERFKSEVFYSDDSVEIHEPVDDTRPPAELSHDLVGDEQPLAACFDNPAYSVRDDVVLFNN